MNFQQRTTRRIILFPPVESWALHLIPIGDEQLLAVLADKDQVGEDEKLGMIL